MTEFREQDLTGACFERVSLRGATFTQVHLNDARLHEVDLTGAHVRSTVIRRSRLRGVELVDVEISGELQNVVVNGIDIAPLVEVELDRRMPERARMRPDDSDGFREALAILERLWEGTVARARTFPEAALHRSVYDEWSIHPDPAPPQLRRRLRGGPDDPRRRAPVAPAGPALGRGTTLGRLPVGARGTTLARRGARPPPRTRRRCAP